MYYKKTLIILTVLLAVMITLSSNANAGTKAKGDVFDYMNNPNYTLYTINTILGSAPTDLKMAPVYNLYIFISDSDHVTCHAMLGGKKSKCFKLENK
jgi:hypothetical protein